LIAGIDPAANSTCRPRLYWVAGVSEACTVCQPGFV